MSGSICGPAICAAKADKGGESDENFGKIPLSAALTGRGGGFSRKTPNYQLVSICSSHLLLATPSL